MRIGASRFFFLRFGGCYLHSVDCDAPVRTYGRACAAAYAVFPGVHVCEMIPAVVHFLGLKIQHIAGTCHYTQVATLAAFLIDLYCAFEPRIFSCHPDSVLKIVVAAEPSGFLAMQK